MPVPLDPAALQELSLSGTTLVFPNVYAAELWRARLQTAFDKPAQIKTPLAWSEWLEALWSDLILEGAEDRMVLNRLQEEQVWSELIGEHTSSGEFLDPSTSELARLARSALERASTHSMLSSFGNQADTPDSIAFSNWYRDFRTRCAAQRWIASSLLEHALAAHATSGRLRHLSHIHLVGFERFTPAQEQLIRALHDAGTEVGEFRLFQPSLNSRFLKTLQPNKDKAPIESAVALLAHFTGQHAAESSRMALICSKPEDQQHELKRLLLRQIAPDLQCVAADLSTAPWSFATRESLISLQIIADAVETLLWTLNAVTLERVAGLLRSPYFTWGLTVHTRERLADAIRGLPTLRSSYTFTECCEMLQQIAPSMEDSRLEVLEMLGAFINLLGNLRSRRTFSGWCEYTHQLLTLLGWPGTRSLSATDSNAIDAWDGVLDSVQSLDAIGAGIPWSQYLSHVSAEVRRVPAPIAHPDAPIQILGLEESAAQCFDFAIVLDDIQNPISSPEVLNPLLSSRLQREVGVGCRSFGAQRAKDSIMELAQRCSTLIFVSPQLEEENIGVLRPFTEGLGFASLEPEYVFDAEEPEVTATEAIVDPPIPAVDTALAVHGGADLLRLQAACAFQAFSTYRLGAKEYRFQSLGLDARRGGEILHAALEFIWKRLENQTALKGLCRPDRVELIQQAISSAFWKHNVFQPKKDPWSGRYLSVLRKRFTTVLDRWLDLELKRSTFSVEALEQTRSLSLAGLQLQLRVDRIDRVEGGLLFIDYKSSSGLSKQDWDHKRLRAPQLPVYALSQNPNEFGDIAFGVVRPGTGMGWKSRFGLTGDSLSSSKSQPGNDAQEQLVVWRNELTRLAGDFLKGSADVNPNEYPHTCKYCAHRTLCRLNPATLQSQEDESSEEDDILE